jgi:hypothetical protein
LITIVTASSVSSGLNFLRRSRNDHPPFRAGHKEALLYELRADATTRGELLAEIDCDAIWLEGTLQQFVDKELMIFMDDKYLSLALPENHCH